MNRMDYIRRSYGVPAKVGMRVSFNGMPGTITGVRGAYLLVRLAGQKRPRPYHPQSIEYPTGIKPCA